MADGGSTGGSRRSQPAILLTLLVVARLALAIGYAWRASARRAAMFDGEPLPAISDLAQLDEPLTQPAIVSPEDQPIPESDTPAPQVLAEGDESGEEPKPVERLGVDDSTEDAAPVEATDHGAATDPEHAFFVRHTGLDASYGVMSVLRLGASGEDRRGTSLRCDRVHFARDRGVCLTTDRFYTTHSIRLFDPSFETLHVLPLNGVPSRTRVSRDGRRAAVTVFVSGHSYAEEGFSTATSIIDTDTGRRVVTNLEEFDIRQDGQPVRAIDINFWGVTFTDDNDHFYATLGTGGRVYLVEGRVSERRVTVLREGVECPSLSPDQTRIAFKKRIPTGTSFVWRLHVLDLATFVETPLAETRHVDDQVEWLDDTAILYALPDPSAPTVRVTDIWQVPADGDGEPSLLLPHAFSPAVLDLDDLR